MDDEEVMEEGFEEEAGLAVDEVDEAEFEDGEIVDDDLDDDIADVVEGDEVVEEDEEEDEPAVPAHRARTGDDDEDDEDPDPDDVEADLDTILKDRIAASDDSEDDEEEEAPVDRSDPELAEGVIVKREGEFTCEGCFMIVHPRQFGRRSNPVCPVGDEDCPAIAIISAG